MPKRGAGSSPAVTRNHPARKREENLLPQPGPFAWRRSNPSTASASRARERDSSDGRLSFHGPGRTAGAVAAAPHEHGSGGMAAGSQPGSRLAMSASTARSLAPGPARDLGQHPRADLGGQGEVIKVSARMEGGPRARPREAGRGAGRERRWALHGLRRARQRQEGYSEARAARALRGAALRLGAPAGTLMPAGTLAPAPSVPSAPRTLPGRVYGPLQPEAQRASPRTGVERRGTHLLPP